MAHRLFPYALAVGVAAIVGYAISTQYTSVLDCDGYGTYCPYPVDYSKSLLRNATEEVTANRAAQLLADITSREKHIAENK